MILRIVRGRVRPGCLGALAEGYVNRYAPLARATPGLVRFHVAVRPVEDGHELVVVTFWASVDAALAAYDGDLDALRTLDGLSDRVDFATAEFFEVDESQLRRSTADVAVLRITVGTTSRGIDASIQQELRARLHELDGSLIEAHVGRRIVGAEVQVAFISAWQEIPADRSLDEPIWPDISSRYDAFSVATYVPVVSGAEPI
jgi:heme-degrading monooxygenase HmoA